VNRLRATAVLALLVVASVVASLGAPAVSGAERGYALDVSRRSDFVAQTNNVQCVGASMQMMLNMLGPDDRSSATQLKLQKLARSLSPPRPDGGTRKGASVVGWSEGLNQLGAGPYRLFGALTIDEALSAAARAISRTGKPVGMLMWQGRHAWVMSGFRATADPSDTTAFKVTAVTVLDPLYPRVSPRWGRGPRPGEVMSVAKLGEQFLPRRTGSQASVWLAGFAGMYVIVAPYKIIRQGSARRP
jgi:hypothetical protein